jgi:toxin ParE1/3/4
MEEYNVTVTPGADRDMDEIFAYIAEKLKAPGAALNQIERMYTALNSLSAMPKRHPLSRDQFLAKQGFRLLPIDNYLAFYVVEDATNEVIVHRVIYAKRNYLKLFLDEED